ncbi:hypothetical protein BDN72DRAFT_835658 [Pluteus cervinus]|uniref:Uncharacterized protein n=1 Tax=Pluteus cervinus TaxID=181527 RepID=A0ACD3B4P5_9AGAR|nr:hypothetical protein BDN72DRAFT_835658 [Pluteus cervinus]
MLRACSQVCWSFREPSQALLFSRITLTSLRITQLSNICSSDRLSAYVRVVAFTFPDWGLTVATVRGILSGLPNIRTLKFSPGARISHFMFAFVQLQPRMKIEHVDSGNHKEIPLELLRIFPDLNQLTLIDADISGLRGAILPSQERNQPPALRQKLKSLSGKDYAVRAGERPLSYYLFSWLTQPNAFLDISELQHLDWRWNPSNPWQWNTLPDFTQSVSRHLRSLVLYMESTISHPPLESHHISLATFSSLRVLDFRLRFSMKVTVPEAIRQQNLILQIIPTLPEPSDLKRIEVAIHIYPSDNDLIHQDSWRSLDSLLIQERYRHLSAVSISLYFESLVTQRDVDFAERTKRMLASSLRQMVIQERLYIRG